MTTQDSTVEQSNATTKSRGHMIWGWVLLLPALICCVSELVVPTLKTVLLSLQRVDLFGDGANFIGLENYARLFQHNVFLKALGFTLLLTLIRLLVVAVVPPLLALMVNQFGRPIRIPVRLLYTLPIVTFAPVIVAVTWFSLLNPEIGLLNQASLGPQQTRQMFLAVDALYTLGLAVGIGLVVYLAALRYPGQESPSRKQALIPLAVGWGIGLLATIALSLQSFSFAYVLTDGGPAQATMTLGLYQYTLAFQQFRFGVSAAVSTLTLIILTLLGVVATFLILWSGLKLKTISWDNGISLLSGMNKPLAIILLIIMLLTSISIGALSLLPAFWNTLSSFSTETSVSFQQIRGSLPLIRIFINGVGPVAGALLFIQLPIAYLGALAIGALRPLGHRSEWLLLLFAPWLFVGIVPLSADAFLGAQKMGTLNTFIGLMPPILISVPILFILTLFFKGHAAEWNAAKNEGLSPVNVLFKKLILPSLPLTALLATIAFFVGLQTLLWPLIVATKPTQMTLITALLRLYFEFGPTSAGIIVLFWLPAAVLFLIIFGIFQIFYMDRLSLFK